MWTVFLFALALVVVYASGRVIIVFAVALLFSHLLSPVVTSLKAASVSRATGVFVADRVSLSLMAIIVAVMISLGERICDEAACLRAASRT